MRRLRLRLKAVCVPTSDGHVETSPGCQNRGGLKLAPVPALVIQATHFHGFVSRSEPPYRSFCNMASGSCPAPTKNNLKLNSAKL